MSTATIKAGDSVMLKVPNGETRNVTLSAGRYKPIVSCDGTRFTTSFMSSTISLGRYGNFFADQLIGQLYGKRFEIHDKLLIELSPLTVEDIGLSTPFALSIVR
jgi:hypothetical protein